MHVYIYTNIYTYNMHQIYKPTVQYSPHPKVSTISMMQILFFRFLSKLSYYCDVASSPSLIFTFFLLVYLFNFIPARSFI